MQRAIKLFLSLAVFSSLIISCHPHYKGAVLHNDGGCREFEAMKPAVLEQVVTREASAQELTCAIKRGNVAVPKSNMHIGLAYYYLADAETDMDRRYALAKKGLYYGEWAIKDSDNDGRGNYVVAVNLGLLMQQDLLKAIGNVGKLKENLEIAIEKQPAFDNAGAYRVLGQLYVQAPAWPASIGDPDMAVELLLKAVEIAPEHPINQLFLADAIWESEGAEGAELALEHFDKAQQLFQLDEWQLARKQWQTLIDKLIKRLAIKDSCK